MSKRFEMAWYLTEMPDHEQLCGLLVGLRKLLPGSIDRYELMNWAGNERRGKYDENTLLEKLQTLEKDDITFVSLHTRMKPDEAYVPRNMVTIQRRFLEDNPITFASVYLPFTDVVDPTELSRQTHCLVSSRADVRYGFAFVAPRRNENFDYSAAMASYVDRRPAGYKIVEDLADRLMKSEATLNPLIEGRMVRSVYPLNIVSASLADDIRQVLKAARITKTGSFSELSGGKILWCVTSAAVRAEIFNALHSAGMTLEIGWLDLENYRPRFATMDDVT